MFHNTDGVMTELFVSNAKLMANFNVFGSEKLQRKIYRFIVKNFKFG